MRDLYMTMEISQKIFFRAQFIRVASRPSESQAPRKAADLIAPEEELPETEPLALLACGHVSRRSLLRLHTCGFIATSIPSPHQSRDLSTRGSMLQLHFGCSNEAGEVFCDCSRSTPRRNVMKGFVRDIESIAVKNEEFRRVLYTATNCQLVVMALKPQEEIGAEVHTLDQFFRVEEGTGEAILDGTRTAIQAGFAIIVPAGANHNIINTGNVPLKLYTIYAPPNHRDGIVHQYPFRGRDVSPGTSILLSP